MNGLIDRLLSSRRKLLKDRPVKTIVGSLGWLSRRWLDRRYLYRKKAVERLQKQSRFSEEMAQQLLDSLFVELTEKKLWRLLRSELRDPLVLDTFRSNAVTGVFEKAEGPHLITHLFAASVPNPAIVSFALGMLVKGVNVGKLSKDDPGFLDIYLQSLAASDRMLAETNHLLPVRDRASVRNCIRRSDLVVAYGHDETIEKIRKAVPARASLFSYGHRVSFGLLARASLGRNSVRSLAGKLAHDVWMLDQRGCLSPTTVYVQHGGAVSPLGFSKLLADELEKLWADQKRPATRSLGQILQIEGLRNRCVFRKMKGENACFFGGAQKGAWAVVYDERTDPVLSGGPQTVFVKGFRKPTDIYEALRPVSRYLQCAAVEAPHAERKKIAETLSELGVNRVCRAGSMQHPPIAWHHDGKWNLASWVRWTDLE